jgi:deoxyribonucleoside regulator
VNVARAYYEQGLTQEQIGSGMNLSRSQVSRYLSEAREVGIVQFRIIDLGTRDETLQNALLNRFPKLRKAVVIPLFSEDIRMARQTIGVACAQYLQEAVHSGDCLGIGSGRTIRQAILALKSHPVPNLSVVQVMGSLGHEAIDIDFNELTRAAATAFGARPYYVNAPAIVGAGSAAELEAANPIIHDSLERARHATVYLVGIGSYESSQLFARVGLIPQPDFQYLWSQELVGDICARFFDFDGNEYKAPFSERIVGIELKDLKQARLSIGVAGGHDKAAPLRAALHTGWINVVITDEQTGHLILKLDEEGGPKQER